MRWVGKIVSPSCSVGTIADQEPRALLRALLGVVGERRLVPVVAVGDQQLRVGEDAGWVALEAPEPAAHAFQLHLEHALSVRPLQPAVVEQEDRLHLGA